MHLGQGHLVGCFWIPAAASCLYREQQDRLGCPGSGPWDGKKHVGLILRECGQHWDREKRGQAEKSYDLSYNGTQSLLSIPGDSTAITVSVISEFQPFPLLAALICPLTWACFEDRVRDILTS